jgi:hypothetical protein
LTGLDPSIRRTASQWEGIDLTVDDSDGEAVEGVDPAPALATAAKKAKRAKPGPKPKGVTKPSAAAAAAGATRSRSDRVSKRIAKALEAMDSQEFDAQ